MPKAILAALKSIVPDDTKVFLDYVYDHHRQINHPKFIFIRGDYMFAEVYDITVLPELWDNEVRDEISLNLAIMASTAFERSNTTQQGTPICK